MWTDMPEWINTVFDVVMLLAVMGMWLLWWRTSRKQRMIETMLLEAAKELETATARLGESFESIRRLKREIDASQAVSREEALEPPKKVSTEAKSEQKSASGQITQMLRMRREGKDIDAIAESLNLPKAQVKLLLRLHAAGE